jgi:probable F420-dependent oxidoreductase
LVGDINNCPATAEALESKHPTRSGNGHIILSLQDHRERFNPYRPYCFVLPKASVGQARFYRSGKFVDPFIALARASAVTTKITLGTGVCLIPEHNPLLLAKQVATLDNFSGGRFIFGVGAGWLREETQIMGGDYDHRWGQTREAILAMKELWTKDEAEFHGKYYDFPPMISFPKPLQQPHPPIYVGAMTAGNVFRRVVTYGNGWMLWLYTPEQIRDGRAMLDKLAREFGRNPRSIVVVAAPVAAEPDVIKQYEDAGADGIVVFVTPAAEQEMLAELEQIAAKIIG